MEQTSEQKARRELRLGRIVIPVLLGLGVVSWMMYQEFTVSVLESINPGLHTLGWIAMAALMYVFRHLFFAWRLQQVTDGFFGWVSSIRMIVLWEFSTAVSPTSVGGAGVALYLLSKEGLSGSRTITTIMYNMISDTVVFMTSLPLWYFLLGPVFIRPGMVSLSDIDGYGIAFLSMAAFIYSYGILLVAGLFIWPGSIAAILHRLSRNRFLVRWQASLTDTATDMVTTATHIRKRPFLWHLKVFSATLGAWMCRFCAIPFLFLAFISVFSPEPLDVLLLVARGQAMHLITAATPTPGAAGVAEFLFGGFYSDYIPIGMAAMIALVWRLLGYYSYLIAGIFVIPVWWRSVVNTDR